MRSSAPKINMVVVDAAGQRHEFGFPLGAPEAVRRAKEAAGVLDVVVRGAAKRPKLDPQHVALGIETLTKGAVRLVR